MLDSKFNPKIIELNIIKLASIVDDEHKKNPEPDNNILLNNFFYLGFDDHRQWLGYHPLGEVVYGHNEEFFLCYHWGKWIEDIDPPLCEGPWSGDGHQRD